MLNLAFLVSGGGSNLQAVIDYLQKNKNVNAKIKLVISNAENAFALSRAENAKIESKVIVSKNNPDFGSELLSFTQKFDLDLLVTAGFLPILDEQFVSFYKNKIINIHPSLLPKYSGKGFFGLRVHEEVLKQGDSVTGATVHFVDSGIDTGAVIMQKTVKVKPGDDAESLQKRVMQEAEWVLLPEVLRLFSENKVKLAKNIVEILP